MRWFVTGLVGEAAAVFMCRDREMCSTQQECWLSSEKKIKRKENKKGLRFKIKREGYQAVNRKYKLKSIFLSLVLSSNRTGPMTGRVSREDKRYQDKKNCTFLKEINNFMQNIIDKLRYLMLVQFRIESNRIMEDYSLDFSIV